MISRRVALVTGVAGQDGVYLARHLIEQGWHVHGVVRPGTASNHCHLPYLQGVVLHELDLRSAEDLNTLLAQTTPRWVFNLAAQSSVAASWIDPELTHQVNVGAVVRLLDAIRDHAPTARLFQASSAELRDGATLSPYARSKQEAHHVVTLYRQKGWVWTASGVLFNHESPLRSERFLTRKVVRGLTRMLLGEDNRLTLGNLDAVRDWGAAYDYVVAMEQVIGLDEPTNLEICTGVGTSVKQFVDLCAEVIGVPDVWDRIDLDDSLIRPQDASTLVGDPKPADRELGWQASTLLASLVTHMAEVERIRMTSGVAHAPEYLMPNPHAQGET